MSSSELVQIEKPRGNQTKALQLELRHEKELGAGGAGKVVRAVFAPHKDRRLVFAHKLFHSQPFASNLANKAIDIHNRFKSLPETQEFITPTLRKTEYGLLMTDLSQDGKNLVMSMNDWGQILDERISDLEISNPQLLDNFVAKFNLFHADEDDDENNWESEVDKRVDRLALAAAKAKIKLASDSILFVFYPNGEYRLYVADFDNVKIMDAASIEELYRANKEIGKTITEDMKILIKNLWFALTE